MRHIGELSRNYSSDKIEISTKPFDCLNHLMVSLVCSPLVVIIILLEHAMTLQIRTMYVGGRAFPWAFLVGPCSCVGGNPGRKTKLNYTFQFYLPSQHDLMKMDDKPDQPACSGWYSLYDEMVGGGCRVGVSDWNKMSMSIIRFPYWANLISNVQYIASTLRLIELNGIVYLRGCGGWSEYRIELFAIWRAFD